ncbi:MAG: DNA mismatch repair endonuclease MutL [Myxococcota bacterium]
MSIIQVLDPKTADQIAAGEVIEGPWCVVKELVENALDAQANHIDVHVQSGGIQRVVVTDDGTGMSEQDARLCTQRHATSKLRALSDLDALSSFGFRGEAMAAIAAVSRMQITSRMQGQSAAFCLQLEAGRILSEHKAGASVGTCVQVDDLFFNTPARRQFLKTTRWEAAAIEQVMRDLALSCPHVAICLRMENKQVLHAPAVAAGAPLESPVRMERAVACLGQAVRDELYPFCAEEEGLRLCGYLVSPLVTRRDSRGIKLFVNGRCVVSTQLTQAVKVAYRTLLEVGRFPICALDIQLNPAHVDVNVHPQKREVRFRQSDRIQRRLIGWLGDFLSTTPWLRKHSCTTPKELFSPAPRGLPIAKSRTVRPVAPVAALQYQAPAAVLLQQPKKEEQHFGLAGAAGFGQLRVVGQVAKTFLVLEGPDGMVVLDQHAAHERVVFQQLQQDVARNKVSRQSLLLPIQLPLQPEHMQALQEHAKDLMRYGLQVEPFGESHAVIKALPACLKVQAAQEMIRDAFAELHRSKRSDALQEHADRICATMACHGSIRSGQTLSHQEISALLRQLDAIPFAAHCPHGRPILRQFLRTHMARWFDRPS